MDVGEDVPGDEEADCGEAGGGFFEEAVYVALGEGAGGGEEFGEAVEVVGG